MLEYFLHRNIESGFKKNKNKKHSFLDCHKIKNILILFDYKDWDSIKPIINDLEKNGKHVIIWTIMSKSESSDTLPDNVRVLNLQKDLNWLRVFRKEILSEFTNLKYDTFLDLSLEDNDYMMSLRVRNSSVFSLGFRELKYKIFDFIILKEPNNTLFEAYNQMKIYLGHLK